MGKMKHVVAIIIVLTSLIGGFIFLLPKLSGMLATDSTTNTTATDSTTVQESVPDTLSFEEKMQQALLPLEVSYSKRKKRHIWTMGGGQTVIMYLLQAQRFIEKNGGKILFMEELYNNNEVFQAAKVDLIKDNGDTLNLEFQVSRNEFKPGASILAVAFQVTTLTPELIVSLNQLDFKYDLLVPPFGTSDDFYRDLDRIKRKEIALWIPMESTKLNKAHNKLRPLRIHHTEEQIENVITEAHRKFPEAKGIASRYGDQAVEHRQLLQAILKPTKEHGLWFADISMNKLSIVPQTCQDMEMTCKCTAPYNPDNSSLSDYTKAKLREAKRNGLATMILPLNQSSLDKLGNLSEIAQKQGTTIVNLSTFMKK
ncbi:MAG: divergent polysaccharide deacetylase family protein [Fibrobacter sp.]|nr:divergent polysaccharide deacetylase family protein [Fibrobacter sp.]